MRKLLSYIVLFIYVVLSLGVSIHFHYCQGELKTISLFSSRSCCPDDAAGTCGFHSSCCDDESLLLNMPIDHSSPVKLQLPDVGISFAFINNCSEFIELAVHSMHLQLPDSRGAPPDSDVPVYLKLCRITYYG